MFLGVGMSQVDYVSAWSKVGSRERLAGSVGTAGRVRAQQCRYFANTC